MKNERAEADKAVRNNISAKKRKLSIPSLNPEEVNKIIVRIYLMLMVLSVS